MKKLVVVLALTTISAPAYATGPRSCESLAGLHLPDTTITTATVVPAGTFNPAIVTTACRVAGSIRPTSDSDIRFEVWMPTEGWNGKFLSAGEGGYAGSINYGGIGGALRRGYAGGSTDTGHVGGTADFAPGHPEKVTDFGWRGKHLQAARSKDIIRVFYGRSIKHSYFSSCSNGGRQALMEIQRFPEDYDGVLVGAPANNWTHHFAGFIWNEQALFSTPGAHLSVPKLQAVQAETLRTCDALDGVVDGVAEDPRRCKFDPASIACPAGTDGPSCLTPPQVSAVRKIMQGPRNPRTGRQIYPGLLHQRRRRARELAGVDHRPAGRGRIGPGVLRQRLLRPHRGRNPGAGRLGLGGLRFRPRHGVRRPQDRAHHERDRGGPQPLHPPQPARQDHHVARLGGPGDLRRRRGRLLPPGGARERRLDGLLPPLHGAGDAPLRRRARARTPSASPCRSRSRSATRRSTTSSAPSSGGSRKASRPRRSSR